MSHFSFEHEMEEEFTGDRSRKRKTEARRYDDADYVLARSMLRGMTPPVSRDYRDPGYPREVANALHLRAEGMAEMITAKHKDAMSQIRRMQDFLIKRDLFQEYLSWMEEKAAG